MTELMAGNVQRTRPAAPRRIAEVHTVAEAAAYLDVPTQRVERALATGLTAIFPGAFRDADGSWRIPERDLRALVAGRPMQRLMSARTLSELLEVSYFTVRRAVAAGRIRAVQIPELGVQRIPESEYWRLAGDIRMGRRAG